MRAHVHKSRKLLNPMCAHVRTHERTCAHVAQLRESGTEITEHAKYQFPREHNSTYSD